MEIANVTLSQGGSFLLADHPALAAWDVHVDDADIDGHIVPSESDDEICYFVVELGEYWGCSCPQFIHRKATPDPEESGTCKHIRSIRRDLVADSEQQNTIDDW